MLTRAARHYLYVSGGTPPPGGRHATEPAPSRFVQLRRYIEYGCHTRVNASPMPVPSWLRDVACFKFSSQRILLRI